MKPINVNINHMNRSPNGRPVSAMYLHATIFFSFIFIYFFVLPNCLHYTI